MANDLARRILLAMMDREDFRFTAVVTRNRDAGERIQEDYGFTAAEIAQGEIDQKSILECYRDMTLGNSYMKSANVSRLAFLESLIVAKPETG